MVVVCRRRWSQVLDTGQADHLIRAPVQATAPCEFLPGRQMQVLHKIDVDRVARLAQRNPRAYRAIEEALQREARPVGILPFPAQIHIPARSLIRYRRRAQKMRRIALIDHPFQKIAVPALVQIGPEPETLLVPRILVEAVAVIFMRALKTPSVESVAQVSVHESELQRVNGVILRSRQPRRHRSTRFRSLFGDDVDDTVRRVRSPDRSARPPDHLDPIDVFQRHILHVPVHPREQRRVDVSSVDQNQNGLGEVVLQPANTDRPGRGTQPPHLHPGSQPQRIRD